LATISACTDDQAMRGADSEVVGKDIFLEQDRCTYCGRPARIAWDSDLVSCRNEVCQTLASAQVRQRALRLGTKVDRRLGVRRRLGARRGRLTAGRR